MWLLRMEQTDGFRIMHAIVWREYRPLELPKYSLVGYCPGSKTYYEFFGCFYPRAPWTVPRCQHDVWRNSSGKMWTHNVTIRPDNASWKSIQDLMAMWIWRCRNSESENWIAHVSHSRAESTAYPRCSILWSNRGHAPAL